MLITLKFLLSALAVLLLAPIQALALPFTVQAFAHAVTANGADTHNSGVLANTLSTHVSSGSADNFASGTASASAAPGTLGAFARAASLSSSFGGATASASARFSDALTLVSQTLGLGDPVTLLFTLGVDGLLDGCVICPAQGNFSSSFSVAGTGSYVNNLSSVTFGQAFVGGTSNISPELIPPAIVLTTTLEGATLAWSGVSVYSPGRTESVASLLPTIAIRRIST
jgi:hypothetical protein